MPELPEVEIYRRNLDARLAGRKIAALHVLDDNVVRLGDPQSLVGRRIEGFRRRGKFLSMDVFGDTEVVIHLRMTGKVVLLEEERPHIRCTWELDNGELWGFVDLRRLGGLFVVQRGDYRELGVLARMGPEPWPEPLDPGVLGAALARTKRAVKLALMDQELLAGIGNILASECLYAARIDPTTPAKEVPAGAVAELATAICDVCQATIEAEQGAEVVYINEPGRDAESPFVVYDKEGEPCPRCNTPIARFVQSKRSTYWCPTCQQS